MSPPIEAVQPVRTMRLGRALRFAVGLLISAACVWALLQQARLSDIEAALARAQPLLLAASLGGVALAYAIRIERWAVMLRCLGGQARFADAAAPLMVGVALNNLLPLRAGDVTRIVAFRKLTNVGPSMQLGSLVLERLLDLASLMAILFATLATGAAGEVAAPVRDGLAVGAAGVLAAVVGFLIAPAPLRVLVRAAEARLPRLRSAGESVLRLSQAISALSRPLLLVRLSGLSLAAWLCEGSAYVLVAQALQVRHGVTAGFLALGLGTLATMIPSSPGYVGTFHYFAALALREGGTPPALAAAFAILIHAILWLTTTTAGLLLLATVGAAGWRANKGASRERPA